MIGRVAPAPEKIGFTTAIFVTLLTPLAAAVRVFRRLFTGHASGAQLGSMSERWTTQHRASRPRH
jgi:hypothetical protein